MADFLSILAAHAARWPLMTPQDAVKLCYQSAFGPVTWFAMKARLWTVFFRKPRRRRARRGCCLNRSAADFAARIWPHGRVRFLLRF